eukprot:scaffold43149_cov54-Attheya_sp.AAC.1
MDEDNFLFESNKASQDNKAAITNVLKWVGKGAALNDAEYDSLKGKENKVRMSYDKAISYESRAGFLQDAALANERADILVSYWSWGQSMGNALFISRL